MLTESIHAAHFMVHAVGCKIYTKYLNVSQLLSYTYVVCACATKTMYLVGPSYNLTIFGYLF